MQGSDPAATKIPHRWRHLPHSAFEEAAQFLTLRLADSLPSARLNVLRDELTQLSSDEKDTARRKRIEAELDTGGGTCRLKDARIACLVRDALSYFDGERYRLHAWVIMPNHLHVLLTPVHGYRLGDTVRSWKSYTARRANSLLGRSGPFWQADYFDRGIRDERQFYTVWAYIEGNPTRAGLCGEDSEWIWSSAYDTRNAGGNDE